MQFLFRVAPMFWASSFDTLSPKSSCQERSSGRIIWTDESFCRILDHMILRVERWTFHATKTLWLFPRAREIDDANFVVEIRQTHNVRVEEDFSILPVQIVHTLDTYFSIFSLVRFWESHYSILNNRTSTTLVLLVHTSIHCFFFRVFLFAYHETLLCHRWLDHETAHGWIHCHDALCLDRNRFGRFFQRLDHWIRRSRVSTRW